MAPYADKAPGVVGTVLTLFILGFIVFPLRIWIRRTNQSWGWDDVCMLLAVLPFIGLSVVCLLGAFSGIGVKEAALSTDEVNTALMWFWLFEVFWCLAVVPIKLSLALTIGRLGRIASGKQPYIYAIYVLTAILTAITMAGMFYIIFRCTPVSYAWNTTTPNGHCQATEIVAAIYYATTAINILVDWVCALLPIPLLWNAPLTKQAKLSIGFLLSLGVLASISACVRQDYTTALTLSLDKTRNLGDLVIWGYAEVGIGFFVGSLSTLRPLFVRTSAMPIPGIEKDGEQELYELHGDSITSLTFNRLSAIQPNQLSPVSGEIESHFQHYTMPHEKHG
ncbi:hypothetical protein LTR62_002608 [Meristemomyces frigidus]|uniref:Rhodopsin domain-containing protein n=1 Tax=Meristemomyces frigidus TaxID=1508187 RepID=A0AAN7TKM2_9PEZI|nr:hypothetical protein LTR62_002608 [Meristemomyces frigidus]